MGFDAAAFLAELFDGSPAPSGIGPAPEPPAADGPPATDSPEPTAEALPEPTPSPFDGWVLRPDVTGRLGWEPPDLPEAARWWARSTFEDLPASRPEPRRPGIGPCYWCGRRDWWRSVHWPDVVRCGNCHPPAPGVAVEWLDRSQAGPAGEAAYGGPRGCAASGSVDA